MVDLLDTYIEERHRIQPHHANNYGTTHGGRVLYWMDEIGAMSAMRCAGTRCVTAHISSVDFERPLVIGDIAFLEAYAYETGTTSVKVRVRVYDEDPLTGECERTTESYFVFVAIDEQHDPTSVPELTTGSAEGEQLRAEARDEE